MAVILWILAPIYGVSLPYAGYMAHRTMFRPESIPTEEDLVARSESKV
jgi:hypothetical protein